MNNNLMVIKDDRLLDPRDVDLLKMKYDYLTGRIDEALALVEKQLNLLRENDRLISELNVALKTVKAKYGASVD